MVELGRRLLGAASSRMSRQDERRRARPTATRSATARPGPVPNGSDDLGQPRNRRDRAAHRRPIISTCLITSRTWTS